MSRVFMPTDVLTAQNLTIFVSFFLFLSEAIPCRAQLLPVPYLVECMRRRPTVDTAVQQRDKMAPPKKRTRETPEMSLRFGTVSSRAFASLSKECSIPHEKRNVYRNLFSRRKKTPKSTHILRMPAEMEMVTNDAFFVRPKHLRERRARERRS